MRTATSEVRVAPTAARTALWQAPAMPAWVIGLVLPVAVALVWEAAARFGWFQTRLVPPPSKVAETVIELWRNGDLARHVAATVWRRPPPACPRPCDVAWIAPRTVWPVSPAP